MIWLNIYIIGLVVSFIVLTISDGLADRNNNNFGYILAYSAVWPFWWVYFTVNSIIEKLY